MSSSRTAWQHVMATLLLVAGFLVTFQYSSRSGGVDGPTGTVPAATITKSFRPMSAAESPSSPRTLMMLHSDTNTTRPPKQRDRPYFVFHIGPPKTATTSLQYALTHYQEMLKQDSYHYLGQTMLSETNMWRHLHGQELTILKDRPCMRQTSLMRRNRKQTKATNAPTEPRCWSELRQLLRNHREANESLILSEENFSIKYIEMAKGPRDSVDWYALAELLAELDYQPLILIGYRRLFDIMPSAKQQWDRWTRTQKSLNFWPGQMNGRSLQPLFPGVLKDTRLYDDYIPLKILGKIEWSYTDYLVRAIRPHLPVRLINMHSASESLSLRTYFLCHVLPYAPAACAQSAADDLTDPEPRYNPEQSLFYDALTCEAARRGWIDKDSFRRHDVNLALQDYYEKHHGGKVQSDIPLLCPPRDQLDILLERSLVKEEQLWPPNLAEAWRASHVEAFERAVAAKKFCWIDINATLTTQPQWKEWFTSLRTEDVPNVTANITAANGRGQRRPRPGRAGLRMQQRSAPSLLDKRSEGEQ